MSDTHANAMVGINWGSSNFRAYLIDDQGMVQDTLEASAGVAHVSRDGMVEMANQVRQRWPGALRVYAAGMIGSNIGWIDAGYIDAPAGLAEVSRRLVATQIGALSLQIVPGVTCVRSADGAPDIMRGEETELFGLMAAGQLEGAPVVALPGTHTKWVTVEDGRIREFMTALSGELFDRLSSGGVLASVVTGPGEDGPAFRDGVQLATRSGQGLSTLLFGVRARVIRRVLSRDEASAFLRGVLIGSEIADARALFPALGTAAVPLVGSGPVCALYAAALESLGLGARKVTSADAVVRGFVALDARCHASG
ncbi:MAG: 2-dehydro-3-deoxygalactonokinase [Pseudoxanthomonas sp.]